MYVEVRTNARCIRNVCLSLFLRHWPVITPLWSTRLYQDLFFLQMLLRYGIEVGPPVRTYPLFQVFQLRMLLVLCCAKRTPNPYMLEPMIRNTIQTSKPESTCKRFFQLMSRVVCLASFFCQRQTDPPRSREYSTDHSTGLLDCSGAPSDREHSSSLYRQYSNEASAPPPQVLQGWKMNCVALDKRSWLEVRDKQHRYGKNLRLYFKVRGACLSPPLHVAFAFWFCLGFRVGVGGQGLRTPLPV